ncbi:hypothetical protein KJ786_02115 [Patescibacteria group bacterium]|nr:hypothetical protein [Patescibacteria group bacterium]
MISKYKVLLTLFIFLGAILIAPLAVSAQEENAVITSEADQALAESADLSDEPEVLESVTIEEPKSIPSNFGLWWRNLKEQISLVITFNPVKKAEKQLKFAEERIKLAEYTLQNSTGPKIQEKAQKMVEKANEYIQKVEEKKNELAQSSDLKAKTILKDVAKHYLNTERVFEKIEDKLPPEKLEQFQQIRERIEERQGSVLEEIKNNFNVSQEIKDKVIEVGNKIKEKLQIREEFRAEQKDILDEIKAGNQEAKNEFQQLRQEKEQKTEELRQQYKEEKTEIIDKVKSGDETAVKELKELNQKQQGKLQEVRQEVTEKAKEIKQEVIKNVQVKKEQMQQNREELKETIKANKP